jgi:hypothetical protein
MMPREKWTDDRLDDLSEKVDDGFNRVDKDIRELRSEIKELRGEMNTRFDSMQRAHYAGVVAIVAALIATSAF